MRTQNELKIRDPKADLASLPDRLEAALGNGWQRGRTFEQKLRTNGLSNAQVACFTYAYDQGAPTAALWVSPRAVDEWYVSDVVPLDMRDLSDAECDAILREFQATLQSAPTAAQGFQVELVQGQSRLQEELSPECWRRLQALSCAHLTSPKADPHERLEALIIQAHRDGALLDGQSLDDWLKSEGWYDECRREIVHEYDFGRALLAHYDEERGA
jgi:hypothetical protein